VKPPEQPDTLASLRTLLKDAMLSPTGRIAPERELAERLNISRVKLRKALAALEEEGQLVRQVGRGTFLRRDSGAGAASMSEIAQGTSPQEAMQARLVLEPQLARLAALHATGRQIASLRELTVSTRAVSTWEAYEDLDSQFHSLVAEATRNILLHNILMTVNAVRRAVVWGQLVRRPVGPPSDYHSFAEHEAIVAAIEQRDSGAASLAMRRHLLSTASQLSGGLASLEE
jgi:DNA-binding FadR family transcriptional regulator